MDKQDPLEVQIRQESRKIKVKRKRSRTSMTKTITQVDEELEDVTPKVDKTVLT